MITPAQAADVTNYLYAAQALTPVDGMSAVWADYVNDEIPQLDAKDLLPAARLCLKKWANENRSWKVDLPRFVEACRFIRRGRLDEYKSKHGDPAPEGDLTVEEYNQWRQSAIDAICAGETKPEVVATTAWSAINRQPPQLEPTEQHQINTDQIGR